MCDSYDDDALLDALREGIGLLGGLRRFAAPGETLLLKPNVLAGEPPELCVGTHPAVVKAIARLFLTITPEITCGDSPGSGSPEEQLRRAGISAVMEETGVRAADFETPEERLVDGLGAVPLARGALEADGLISLSKLKSHLYTRMTGAVKNLYGCIPGRWKKVYHVRYPDAFAFSTVPVRLNQLLKPRLHVLDGIMGMEGNGPRSGDPVPMGVLLLSSDPVALDSVMCRLVELDPLTVPTTAAGRRLGLGAYRKEEVEIIGEPTARAVNGDFKVRRGHLRDFSTQGMLAYVNNLIGERPVIDAGRCSRCGECVRACPTEPKALRWERSRRPPKYHYLDCIRCFCCQEICPEGAISVRRTVLGLP